MQFEGLKEKGKCLLTLRIRTHIKQRGGEHKNRPLAAFWEPPWSSVQNLCCPLWYKRIRTSSGTA